MLNAEFRMQNSECATRGMTQRALWRRPLALSAFCILHSALLLSLTACGTKAKAQTLPDGPPLAVPIAPVHEIVIEQIAEAPPEPEPERVPEPVVSTPKPTITKVQPGKPQPAQTPPASQPAAVTTPPAPEVVRAAPAASAGDEKKVRDLLTKASNDRDKRVDYQKLSDEGKQQYNQSKRFSEQAEQAIKEKNYPYALSLADKAATLAAELVR